MKRIRDEGPQDARIALVGEAPGRQEFISGRPFSGPSGRKLKEWWEPLSLTRSDFYITNCYPFWPGAAPDAIKKVSKEVIEHWQGDLLRRLASLPNLELVVPTGAFALAALTGRSSILKWRGSLLSCRLGEGSDARDVKCIPTVHPAATFRTPSWARRCIRDWQRIAQELAAGPALHLPQRTHNIQPRLDDLDALLHALDAGPLSLAVDLETTMNATADKRAVLCIGFASSPWESLVVPTTDYYWGVQRLAREVWPALRRILEHGNARFALHNGLFDAFWLLRQHGIRLPPWFDTLGADHCLFATDEHSLAFVASLLTRQPYWKDEGKGFNTPGGVPQFLVGEFERLLWYNGTDACVTSEIAESLDAGLQQEGRADFFVRHYTNLWHPTLDLMCQGIRVDEEVRATRHAALVEQCAHLRVEIEERAGEPLHAAKDLSSLKVQKFLYGKKEDGKLGLLLVLDKHTKRPTANEVAIKRLLRKYTKDEKLQAVGTRILSHRELFRKATQLSASYCDEDGRMRSSYAPFAETGRMRSSSNPFGTGQNCQNQDRALRFVYVPDEPGEILLEVDLSLAEDRVTKALTGAPRLLALANALPGTYDAHSDLAAAIFGLKKADVCKTAAGKKQWKGYRYVAKRGKHASNFGMHERTFSDTLVKDGYYDYADLAFCKRILDAVFADTPELADYHRAVRIRVLNHRRLVNPFGRVMDFTYERLNDDTYRRAYAFVPQSTIADLLNTCGFVPTHRFLQERQEWGRIVAHIHDALLISCKPERAYDIARFIFDSLEVPIEVWSPVTEEVNSIRVWCEAKIGRAWGNEERVGPDGTEEEIVNTQSFERLPSREEFTAAAWRWAEARREVAL